MTSKYESLRNLKLGEKYTLVSMGEFGFPYKVQGVIVAVEFRPYAQYDDAVRITIKPKHKRKMYMYTFYGSKPLIVWNGHVEANTEMITSSSEENGVTVMRSRLSLDPQYLIDAKNSVKDAPIFEC